MRGPDRKLMHGCIRVGNSQLMLTEENPVCGAFGTNALKGSSVTIYLTVADVDRVSAQAVAAGGKITMPVADMIWGDRHGALEDPFCHKWSVATHIGGRS